MDSSFELRTIDQLRQRLLTLSANIRNLNDMIQTPGASLPPWTRINTAHKAVTAQLKALQDLLGDSEKGSFLEAAHAYPTASFPWNEENMLGLLLRKRLEPDVVTWLETGRSTGAALAAPADSTSEGAKYSAARMAGGDWDELWNWAGPAANEIVRYVYNDEDSDDEDDDEDDEEDDMDDEDEQHTLEEQHASGAVSLPLESIMRYTSLAERRIP